MFHVFPQQEYQSKGLYLQHQEHYFSYYLLDKLNSTLIQRSWPLKKFLWNLLTNSMKTNTPLFDTEIPFAHHCYCSTYKHWVTLMFPLYWFEIWGFKSTIWFILSLYFLTYIQCQAPPFLLIIYLCQKPLSN